MKRAMLLMACCLFSLTAMAAEEPVFSGPQVGEKLTAFTVQGVLGDLAGKEIEPLKAAGEKPIVLIFLHEVTRPNVGLTRLMSDYAHKLGGDKLACYVVLMADDATAGENQIKRSQHAFSKEVPLTLSKDGADGPGAYGLNRKVGLTILVGKGDKVTANFALVQPSIPVDAPNIAKAMHAALGEDKTPTLAELGVPAAQGEGMVDLRVYLAPVINRTATEEEVMQAAEKVEAAAAKDPKVRKAVGDATKRIVDAGKLENYGTEAAQAYFKKWAVEFNK